MIEVKLTFASQAELLAFFAGNRNLVSAEEKSAVAAISADKKEATTKPGKPQPAATPAATGAGQAASTTTAAGSPSEGKPAAGAASPAATAASTASQTEAAASPAAIDYPVLQKAVFALAGKNKAAAQELCAKYGVRTFKELDASRWGDALTDVNAALAA